MKSAGMNRCHSNSLDEGKVIANETIQKLGIAIGRDDVLPDDWYALWVVFKIGDGYVEHFADAQIPNAKDVNFLLSSDNLAKKLVRRLHDVMYDDDGKSWVTCKLTLVSETRDVNIQFEYEDEYRWEEPFP